MRIACHLSLIATTIDVATNIDTLNILLLVVGGSIYGIAGGCSVYKWIFSCSCTGTSVAAFWQSCTCIHLLHHMNLLEGTDVDSSITDNLGRITTAKDIVDGSHFSGSM